MIWLAFWGFGVSLAYGVCAALAVYGISGRSDAREFLIMYISRFNMLVSTGLIVGTAFIVGASQDVLPQAIESAFHPEELETTDYGEQKERFFSLERTITFATEMTILGAIVFNLCHFPLPLAGEVFLLIGGCAQWAVASYVGRKIRYAGMMLHSLSQIEIQRNLFRERKLDVINTAAHVATTLTVIFVYLHIRSYYYGPFLYDGFIGKSAEVFLLLPAVIATPVLVIFNFLPRMALRKIYDKSIEVELNALQAELDSETLTPFEKRRKLMDFDKLYHDELRYNLQLTLADLPIGITVAIMLVQPLLKS